MCNKYLSKNSHLEKPSDRRFLNRKTSPLETVCEHGAGPETLWGFSAKISQEAKSPGLQEKFVSLKKPGAGAEYPFQSGGHSACGGFCLWRQMSGWSGVALRRTCSADCLCVRSIWL